MHNHVERLTKVGLECVTCFSFLDAPEPELTGKERSTLAMVRSAKNDERRGDRE